MAHRGGTRVFSHRLRCDASWLAFWRKPAASA